MKIESIIRRPNGTIVNMDAPARTYHFKPEGDSPEHIAQVDIEDHARSFLRITEGYRLVDGEMLPDTIRSAIEDVKLVGSVVHNAKYVIHGETITLEQLVEMACDDSGLMPEQWNSLSDHQRYAYIDATLNELKSGTEGDTLLPQTDIDADEDTADEAGDGDIASGAAAGEAGEGDIASEAAAGEAGEDVVPSDTITQEEDATGTPEDNVGLETNEATVTEKAAEDVPLNQLPARDLRVLFEQKTGVKPSRKLTIADLVAGIEGADE